MSHEITAGRLSSGGKSRFGGAASMSKAEKEEASRTIRAETAQSAILIPFSGFSFTPAAQLDQTQKLKAILANVTAQHELVRGNMVFLAQQKVDQIMQSAETELTSLPPSDEESNAREKLGREREVDDMIESLKVSAGKDAKREDFLYRPGFSSTSPRATDGKGDVEMSSVPTPSSMPRSAKEVQAKLAKGMRELVYESTRELERYDNLCAETLAYYRKALGRRWVRIDTNVNAAANGSNPASPVVKSGTPISGSGMMGGESARVRIEESPLNGMGVRRMSSGMPIPVLGMGEKVLRRGESMEEVARRGSK